MTEYDYSPAAYERHIANLNRVANWVNQLNAESPSNPFAPSDHGSSGHFHRSSRRRSRSRSFADPSTVISHNATGHHEEQRMSRGTSQEPPLGFGPQHVYPMFPISSQPVAVPHLRHGHHSRKSRRSTSRHPSVSDHYHHPPSGHHSHLVPVQDGHVNQRVIKLKPDSTHNNNVLHIPQPRQGERYVIISPPGTKLEVVNPQGHQIMYGQNERERELGRKHENPFSQRFLTEGPGGGRQKSSSRQRSMSMSGYYRGH